MNDKILTSFQWKKKTIFIAQWVNKIEMSELKNIIKFDGRAHNKIKVYDNVTYEYLNQMQNTPLFKLF